MSYNDMNVASEKVELVYEYGKMLGVCRSTKKKSKHPENLKTYNNHIVFVKHSWSMQSSLHCQGPLGIPHKMWLPSLQCFCHEDLSHIPSADAKIQHWDESEACSLEPIHGPDVD